MPPKPPSSLVVDNLAKAWPLEEWQRVNTLVAVSGGADSVALLCAMAQLAASGDGPGSLVAAHFNHRLRGDESDADEQWVGDLCDQLGVTLISERCVTTADHSSEEAARDTRYAFFKQAAAETGARFVATAHTADDQAETVLLRVLRGSGLAGLAAIPRRRPLGADVTLVRPLLGTTRHQVEDYLATLDQPFRTDRTNADPVYARNWVRHSLLPQLTQRLGAGVTNALVGVSEHASEARAVINELARQLYERAITFDPKTNRISIDAAAFADQPALLAREACRLAWRTAGWPEQAMTREHWRHLGDLVASSQPTTAIMLPGGVRAEVVNSVVLLSRQPAAAS